MNKFLVLFITVTALMLAACGGSPSTPPPTGTPRIVTPAATGTALIVPTRAPTPTVVLEITCKVGLSKSVGQGQWRPVAGSKNVIVSGSVITIADGVRRVQVQYFADSGSYAAKIEGVEPTTVGTGPLKPESEITVSISGPSCPAGASWNLTYRTASGWWADGGLP